MKTPREVIINALSQLAEDLGQFEQTTHGAGGPFNFIRLGDALAAAYREPNSYYVSDLSQMCSGIVKELTQQ
jgi:hypothetical protein